MTVTNKSKKKVKRFKRDSLNGIIVKQLMQQFDLTEGGVYKMLRKESDSELAQEVRKTHAKKLNELKEALNK